MCKVLRYSLPVLWVLAVRGWADAQAPSVPRELAPPESAKLAFHAHGRGEQIYVCKESGGQAAWAIKAPRAELLGPDGVPIGSHFAGPTWEGKDGSRVIGKAIASVSSPDTNSIPWLLISAVNHEGEGVMAEITAIQRLNTKGGKAPSSGCDVTHLQAESSVRYEADYYFYR